MVLQDQQDLLTQMVLVDRCYQLLRRDQANLSPLKVLLVLRVLLPPADRGPLHHR